MPRGLLYIEIIIHEDQASFIMARALWIIIILRLERQTRAYYY